MQPTEQNTETPAQAKPRKRRRVFMWTFLAIQALFLIWVIAGSASGAHDAATCHDQYLTHQQCADATGAGTAIGIGLVIFLWVAVDVILGIGRLVVVFARRSN